MAMSSSLGFTPPFSKTNSSTSPLLVHLHLLNCILVSPTLCFGTHAVKCFSRTLPAAGLLLTGKMNEVLNKYPDTWEDGWGGKEGRSINTWVAQHRCGALLRAAQVLMKRKALQTGGSDFRIWQFSSASVFFSSSWTGTSTPLLRHAEPSTVSENLQFTKNVNT